MTSRERLHLRAEREIPVRPLGLPGDDDLDGPTTAPAVEMLVQCVRRFDPEFAVTPDNRAALAEICARLDGLPLGLELAAARLKLFTPGELTFRLRHRLSILTNTARDVPQRHRTLRAALAWSHDLLKPDERAAFRRLSVFVGGATLDAAGEVCDLDDPVATISSLVDKSLLHRRIRPDGATEFVMLESLREYAAELLSEHGEEEAVTARHARYYADLAVLVETAIGGPTEVAWVDSVRFAQGNLRKALAHATAAADAGLSLPLGSALGWYAYTRGHLGDGLATLDSALAVVGPDQPRAPGDSLTRALLIAAVLALGRGDLDDADALLTRVLAVDDDQRRTAIATAFLGHLARARGHHDQAVGHHARAADLFSELGNTPGVAWSRYDLALLARHQGDADGAAGHLRESLSRFREMGDERAVACATWALLTVEMRRDRADGGAAAGEARDVAGRPARSASRPAWEHVGGLCPRGGRRSPGLGPAGTEDAATLSAVPPVAEARRSGTPRRAHGARTAGGAPRRRRIDEPADRAGTRHRREDHRDARAQHHPQARRPEPGRGRGSRERPRAVGLSTDPRVRERHPLRWFSRYRDLSSGAYHRRAVTRGGDHDHCRKNDVLRGGGQVAGGVHLQGPVPVLGRRGPGRGRDVRLDPGLVRRPRNRDGHRRLRPVPVPVRAHPRERARRELAGRHADRRPLHAGAATLLVDVFTGRLGGPIADLAGLIGEVVAVERVSITFDVVDGQGHIEIGDVAEARVSPFWARPG